MTYPEALKLAAESTGNPRLLQGARSLSEAISRGSPCRARSRRSTEGRSCRCCAGSWRRGRSKARCHARLRNLAGHYRKRGKYLAEKLSVFLPTVIMVVIGACAALFYALALFIPIINLLGQLSTN